MLELGGQAGAPAGDLVKDVSEQDFMTEVVAASQEVPVIVDFWAPWCGPCKTLGPLLEDAVRAAGGKVRMAKVNVDENQQIAAQLRVQSIPTVYAFWQGQPVDGFQGAVPGSEISAFVNRVAAMGGDGGLAEAVEAAESMLAEGAAADAAQTFAAILEEEPENAGAYGGLIRAYLAVDDIDQATRLLDSVPAAIANAPEVDAARAQLALAQQAQSAGPVAELMAAVEADPTNQQTRLELAQAQQATGDSEAAIETLLEMVRLDADWNEGAAKAQLFTIFDALKPQDPVALKGRRRLSSLLFA